MAFTNIPEKTRPSPHFVVNTASHSTNDERVTSPCPLDKQLVTQKDIVGAELDKRHRQRPQYCANADPTYLVRLVSVVVNFLT